jgi:hypothetical protein
MPQPTPLRRPAPRAPEDRPAESDDHLDAEPSPGASHEVRAQDHPDLCRRRWLVTVVVVAGGVSWTFFVCTICAVSLLLALLHPDRLDGFVLVAYPSVGGGTVVLKVMERLVAVLAHGPSAPSRQR